MSRNASEDLKELSPVLSDLWKGLEETKPTELTVEEKEKPKKKSKETVKEKVKEESSAEEQEEEEKSVTYQSTKHEVVEEKEEKFPGFDFNDYYEKGQRIYLVKINSRTGSKELIGKVQKLTIRTIYPKAIIAVHEKSSCEVIGADMKDNIFINYQDALTYFESLDFKDEETIRKEKLAKKKMEDSSDIEEEVEDEFSNEKEPLPTIDSDED